MPGNAPGTISAIIGKRVGETLLDTLEVDPVGLIRLVGWTLNAPAPDLIPQVALDQVAIPLLQYYRLARPDVTMPVYGDSGVPPGIVFEYLLPESLAAQSYASLSVLAGETPLVKLAGPFAFHPAVHYRGLLDSAQIFHREDIYGSGPPNAAVQPESLALARTLPAPLLDFGCGSGALVQELRALGIDAYGIELDNPVIRPSLHHAAAPYITLYAGELPTSFAAGRFRSVFCSEVLEHIPDFRAAAVEIARLTSDRAVFTVPDASAIPLGFRHGLVPWHLLEGSHFNFFSQRSLYELLRPLFREVLFGRVGGSHINDTGYHVSLVAFCRH